MKTEDFIEMLAADTQPVSRHALVRRLFAAALAGTLLTLAMVLVLYGLRDDLAAAVLGTSFWMKATFTLCVAALGFVAIERAARPGARLKAHVAFLAAPFVFILALADVELGHTVPADRVQVWLGQTWQSCPFSIMMLSLPPLVALFVALRRLAPTRPALAGLFAGLLSGGLAASAYGLHCPETSAAFVATWYSLGVIGSGVLGAIAGTRLLRW